jgi:hypothetical protein
VAGPVVQFGAAAIEPEIVDTDTSIDHQGVPGRANPFTRYTTLHGNLVIGDPVWIGAGSKVFETGPVAHVLNAADATLVGDVAQVNARRDDLPAKILCE